MNYVLLKKDLIIISLLSLLQLIWAVKFVSLEVIYSSLFISGVYFFNGMTSKNLKSFFIRHLLLSGAIPLLLLISFLGVSIFDIYNKIHSSQANINQIFSNFGVGVASSVTLLIVTLIVLLLYGLSGYGVRKIYLYLV